MTSLADPAQILDPPAFKRLDHPAPSKGRWGITYRPLLPDGRRQWLLAGTGPVAGPRWDYARSLYVGTDAGGSEVEIHWGGDLAWHVCSQIPGYCREEQGRALYELAQAQAPLGTVVEIGTAKGLSAAWLGLGARDRAGPAARVICVNTYTGPPGMKVPWVPVLDDFQANMDYAGLAGICQPVVSTSRLAVAAYTAGPISLLHIDGFHSYTGARFDFTAWGRFCRPGSVVAFDDCTADYPGVMRLQRELLASDQVELIGRTGAMIAWRLVSPLS